MSEDEAEEFVIGLLRTCGPLTTMEIETSAAREGSRCPDQAVLYLAKLMHKGVIQGEVSIEKRGWVWRIPPTQTPPG